MPARSEPLLWVQLIGAGLFPLEGLLLLLLLAGSDPGPVPGLERLLCWGLGGLAPTLLLWRRPADVWSLLLLQTPLRARRPLQQRLSRLQDNLGLRLGLVLAGALSLPLLWWLDEHAAVATSLSPLAGSPRLVALLLAALLLALMLWQWQQLLQALWLLTRSPEVLAAVKPMPQAELEERHLCLGLPLLLLDPLQLAVAPIGAGTSPGMPFPPVATAPAADAVLSAVTNAEVSAAAVVEDSDSETAVPEPAPALPVLADAGLTADPLAAGDHGAAVAGAVEATTPDAATQSGSATETAQSGPDVTSAAPSGDGVTVAVEPEQAPEQGQGGQLDQQIGGGHGLSG